MNAKSKWIRSRLFFFVFFAVVACIGSFLIHLSLIRFNVVVIGHDDIEMWTISSTTLSERRSNGKRLHIRINLRKRLLSLSDSDFIRNYRTLNVSV